LSTSFRGEAREKFDAGKFSVCGDEYKGWCAARPDRFASKRRQRYGLMENAVLYSPGVPYTNCSFQRAWSRPMAGLGLAFAGFSTNLADHIGAVAETSSFGRR
jgi:hypothetical protein